MIFDLSAKVAHIGVPSTYQYVVFSETTRAIELKIHMKTPYDRLAKINDRLAKINTNCFGHMTKMAKLPIYSKNPLNIFLSGTKRPMALGNWYVKLGMWTLPGLHYLMARSKLLPYAFMWGKS